MADADISPPDSPFHGFSAEEVPRPKIIKLEDPDYVEELSPPDSPFYGFSEAEIPRPIIIKTEAVTADDPDDVMVVEVVRGSGTNCFIKQEVVEEDGEVFHGFSVHEIPKPIFIKDEPDDITVEREVDSGHQSADHPGTEEFILSTSSVGEEETNSDSAVEIRTVTSPRLVEIPLETPGSISNSGQNSSSNLEQVPCSNLEEVPSSTLEQVPSATLEQAPSSNLEQSQVPPSDSSLKANQTTALVTSSNSPVEHTVPAGAIIVRNQTGFSEKMQRVLVLDPVQGSHLTPSLVHANIQIQGEDGGEEPILVMVEGEDNTISLQGNHTITMEGAHDGQHVISMTSDQMVEHGISMEVVEEEATLIYDQKQEPEEGEIYPETQQITIIETGEDHETVKTIKREEIETGARLPRNIQILNEHGSAILLMDQDSESEESDLEDREFTVIVDEDASDDDEDYEPEEDEDDEDEDINLERLGRIPLEDKNGFEGESIEDILAQFESESKSRAVSCPSCKKCFVSQHFLSIHVQNKSTLCELCNTQCCTAANLRNHRNVDCDLSKRKRNIDLIAQETALLGRKPIEPEKYYNMPLDSSDEENEGSPRKPVSRSVNDQKYECGICGQYVKILSSHMKFVHSVDDRALGCKYKCSECGVLVSNLMKHKSFRHDPSNKVVVTDTDLEVVRCKQPGCDIFFNNTDELTEHLKREHSEQVRLACGMGGCNAVFDSRGALRKHRGESHPELEEFKPVDLEPDDPDRDAELTVACPVCERKFKHKNTCTVHIKVHHLGWSKRKMYECPDCMKGFDNKKNMDLHREAIHLGIRTICPLCDKPVTRLDLHVRMVHTDMPEWPCPDCGKKFKRKFDLNRHRVTVHLGVRNFPCDLCGKRFADMKDMTRHKNAVHYGMKIKWNSKKHKEERKRRREIMEKKMKYGGGSRRDKLDKFVRQKNVNFPVEFIDTGSGSTTLHIEDGSTIDESAVILDPDLQSQLGSVQAEGRDARVLIQADPDNSGSLRFVVLQEDMEENGIEIEEEEETHIILEPED